MNYVRTSSGGMMAVTPKFNTVIKLKKQTTVVKPSAKSKKDPASKLK